MYEIEILKLENLPQLMKLHRRIIKHIGGKKDLLIVERDDMYFSDVISRLGFVVGSFHKGFLIGYSSLRRPQPGEENFGEYVELPGSEFPFLAHSNGSMVCPDHRGHNLHRRMAMARADAARELGLRHLLSEVHGSNPPSLRNLFILGFKVRGTKHEDDDDFLIFHQKLNVSEPKKEHVESVLATNNTRQKELLADGLVGFDLDENQGACLIKYGRLLS